MGEADGVLGPSHAGAPAAGPHERVAEVADLRLLLPALVAWAVGAAALAWVTPLRWAVVATCAVVGVAGLLTAHRAPWGRTVVATALVTGLVVGASTLAATQRQQGVVAGAVEQESVVTADVVVEADARRVVTEGRFGRSELVLVRARAKRIVHRGQESRSDAPLLVLARPDAAWEDLTWRTRLTVSGRLSPSEPGDDVVAVLTPSRGPQEVVPPGGGWRVAEGLRAGLRESVDPVWADARGLVPGLVLGDTSLTPEELTEAMTETGMTHLSAVSGSNVAIVVGAVLWAASGLGLPRRARPWVAGAGLVGFVVLARPEPSVLRAGAMGAVALAGMTVSQRAASFPALATSMVVLLVWDPWLARSYGFALSVLATLGLVVFVRPWAAALRRRWPRVPEPLAQALVIPVAAAVTTSPVVAMLQGQISVIGLLTNLLAAPLVAPATICGVLVVLVHPVLPPVAAALAWAAAVPAQLIGLVARWGAAVPHGAIPWPANGPAALGLGVLTTAIVLLAPAVGRGVRVLSCRGVLWWGGAARGRPVGARPGSGGVGPPVVALDLGLVLLAGAGAAWLLGPPWW
ncbi:ComEC/Rec2 family competence protein [Kytococcus sp. Marseille-QA3725]